VRIVVLTGPIGGGKTTLGDALAERFAFLMVKTRELIVAARPRVAVERQALQRAGDALDRETGGAWVADQLARLVVAGSEEATWIVDSARRPQQIEAIRVAFGKRVTHVHVTAPYDVLERRYAERSGPVAEVPSYREAVRNATERLVPHLARIADVVIDTERCTPEDVLVRAASALGIYGSTQDRLVDALIGGQWGSEGKGHVASYLAPEYQLLVRTGGPNAGHTVYEGARGTYTFHQLPSGTRASAANLLLGPGSTIRADVLLREISDCDIGVGRLFIDPQAMIITSADRRREEALRMSIGSTGQGGGAAAARRIMGRGGRVTLARDVRDFRPYLREAGSVLEDAYAAGQRIFVEGTQGTGLSLYHGDYPYVTSRDTTVSGLCAEAGIAPHRLNRVIIVCRSYPIRVESPREASSGPMGLEISWATVADRAHLDADELERVERTSTTGRRRRVAEFNWRGLRRAAAMNGATDVALTFADYIAVANRDARRFEQLTSDTIHFVEEVERVAGCPVSLITTRFHDRSIIDRRTWGKR
jgi:adenylosuccinate synthase